MAKARKRFFEISPSWAGAAEGGLGTDDFFLAPLTAALSFQEIERRYHKEIPSSGEFTFKRPKAIPDLIWATGNAPIVTATFKSVVEATAPGEAEFRPFKMRWPDQEPVSGEWYLMNVLNLVDCFDFEKMGRPRPVYPTRRPTGEIMTDDEIWMQVRLNQCYQSHPRYIDPSPVGSLHVWRPFFQSNLLFCTSELLKALKGAGVRRLHAERLGTRDDPLPVYDWAALGVPLPGTKV